MRGAAYPRLDTRLQSPEKTITNWFLFLFPRAVSLHRLPPKILPFRDGSALGAEFDHSPMAPSSDSRHPRKRGCGLSRPGWEFRVEGLGFMAEVQTQKHVYVQTGPETATTLLSLWGLANGPCNLRLARPRISAVYDKNASFSITILNQLVPQHPKSLTL